MIADLVDQVRGLSFDLRPAALDSYGLEPALVGHLQRFHETTGLRAKRDLNLKGMPRLPEAVESAAFRFIQEGLSNAAKHAKATAVTVVARATDTALYLAVVDDGCGIAKLTSGARKGMGLDGMRERITSVRGSFALSSEPGRGVTVEARIPIGSARVSLIPKAGLPSAESE
ncbi:MAG: two-component system sensor histidine kinase NreB [Rhodothermales bacterium]|jgi:two-component system sensor histidine kinase NreB